MNIEIWLEKITSQTGSSLLAFMRSVLHGCDEDHCWGTSKPGLPWSRRLFWVLSNMPDTEKMRGWFLLLLSSTKEEVWWCCASDTLGDEVPKLGSHLTNNVPQHSPLFSHSPSHSWTSTKFSSRLWKSYRTSEEWCASDVLASKSSDLNPIEMVWDELDHKVKAKKPVRHLWEFLLECWKAIPAEADGEKA